MRIFADVVLINVCRTNFGSDLESGGLGLLAHVLLDSNVDHIIVFSPLFLERNDGLSENRFDIICDFFRRGGLDVYGNP